MPHPQSNLYRRCSFPLPHNPKYQCPKPGTHHQLTLHTYYCRSHDPHASQRCRVRVYWRGKGERCVEMGVSGLEGRAVCEQHTGRAINGSITPGIGVWEGKEVFSEEVSTQCSPSKKNTLIGGALKIDTTLHLATPIFTSFEHSALATPTAHTPGPDSSLATTPQKEIPLPASHIETSTPDHDHRATRARKAHIRIDSLSPLSSPISRTHEPRPHTPPPNHTPNDSASTPSTPLSSTTPSTPPPHTPSTPPTSPLTHLARPTNPPYSSSSSPCPPSSSRTTTAAAPYSRCCICLELHAAVEENLRAVPGCGHVYRVFCLRKMRKMGEGGVVVVRRWNCGGCAGELGGWVEG